MLCDARMLESYIHVNFCFFWATHVYCLFSPITVKKVQPIIFSRGHVTFSGLMYR